MAEEQDKNKDIDSSEIEEIRKKIIRLSLAYQISQELAGTHDLENLVNQLIDKTVSILRVEIGSLMLVDKMQNELRIKAARGLKEEIVKQVKIKFGEGISGWVAKEAKPLLIDDLKKYPNFAFKKKDEKRDTKYSTDSLLTVPLVASGKVIGVLNVNNKITKEIFNEDDMETLMTIANQAALLIKNSQEYEEMGRLSKVKSDFVSLVSHELRTPLATVKEALRLLLDEIPGNITPKQKDILALATHNIDRLIRLINNILDLSKMEAGKIEMKREFIDIMYLVKEAVKSFKLTTEKKGLSVTTHIEDDVKGIWADSDRITQILTNLIGNAVKFTPEGGKVDVTLRKKNKNIEIIVEDNGHGISEEDLNKVFDKFSRLSFKDGGITSIGLGLAITKDIVELHKGSISVESKLGEGSKFTVTLPMDLRAEQREKET